MPKKTGFEVSLLIPGWFLKVFVYFGLMIERCVAGENVYVIDVGLDDLYYHST